MPPIPSALQREREVSSERPLHGTTRPEKRDMPSKKSAYGKMYANYADRVQGIQNGKLNDHKKLKSAQSVHAQARHFEDNDRCHTLHDPCCAVRDARSSAA